MSASNRLPPGQRAVQGFPRFGPGLGAPLPNLPDQPTLTVTGAVQHELRLPLADLAPLTRREQITDFHCVTTWTRRDLRWEGIAFREFFSGLVVPACGPRPDVSHLVFVGADDYEATMFLEDALADDVLLADRLDGLPLTPEHGAPLRLVSPRQYGYKSVKHLVRIELWRERPPGKLGAKEHQRARVWREERHAWIPARLLRLPYRLAIPLTARGYRRAMGARSRTDLR